VAIFGREIIGNNVVDRTGAVLGSLVDLSFDLNTGVISELLVQVEATVDGNKISGAAKSSFGPAPFEGEKVA